MPPLVQVSKEQFYEIIKGERLDVHPRTRPGKYPFTSDWILRSGRNIGTTCPSKNWRPGLDNAYEYWISEEYVKA